MAARTLKIKRAARRGGSIELGDESVIAVDNGES